MDQCEEQGAVFMASDKENGKQIDKYVGFECLEAK